MRLVISKGSVQGGIINDSRQLASINGREVEVREGDTRTIFEAATEIGITIPTLCCGDRSGITMGDGDELAPNGGCRMCMVHVAGEDRPPAACHTPIAAGMVVETHHVKIEKKRQALLELYFSTGRMREDQLRPGPFAEMVSLYGVREYDFETSKSRAYDESHPYLWFAQDACIGCRLCLSVCEEVEAQFVFGIAGRGSAAALVAGPTATFVDSDCTGCGACVEVCPTSAIFDRDRREQRIRGEEEKVNTTPTTCAYCSVGCQMEIETINEGDDQRVSAIRAQSEGVTNQGHLCEKGQYGHRYVKNFDRLEEPMVRSGAGFRAITWEEAYALMVERFQAVDPATIGGLVGGRVTNEAAFLFGALMQTVLGSRKIDAWVGDCHASQIDAALRAEFSAIDGADLLLVTGVNPTVSHPVLGARIKQAVLRGAELIVMDPRRNELGDYADTFWQVAPGGDVAAWGEILSGKSEVTRSLRAARRPLFIFGSGLDPKAVPLIVEAAEATDGKLLPLEGQANARGVLDVVPTISDGTRANAMLSGEVDLKALWLVGANPARTGRTPERTQATLAGLDFLVVQDLFMTESARHADLLLPVAGPMEIEGTMTNTEGRIQHLRRALIPPGRARPDWLIFVQMAERMGHAWPYHDPEEVLEDLIGNFAERFAPIANGVPPEGALLPTVVGPERGEGMRQVPEVDPVYPFLLSSFRERIHLNGASFTRRTEQIDANCDWLLIHPEDAASLGIGDWDELAIQSEQGAAFARAELTDRVMRGHLALSNHFAKTCAGSTGLGAGHPVAVHVEKTTWGRPSGDIASEIAELIDVHKRYREETGDIGYKPTENEVEEEGRRAPAGVAEGDSAE